MSGDYNLWQNRFNALDVIRRQDAYLGPDDQPLFCYRGRNGTTCRMFARRPFGVRITGGNNLSHVYVFCSSDHMEAFNAYIKGKL